MRVWRPVEEYIFFTTYLNQYPGQISPCGSPGEKKVKILQHFALHLSPGVKTLTRLKSAYSGLPRGNLEVM